jgi:L-lactate utilization protein LutC
VRAGESEKKEGKKEEGAGLSTFVKFFLRLYSIIAQRPQLFMFAQKLAALGSGLVSPFSNYIRLPAVTGWGYSKDMPKFARMPFRERFERLEREDKGREGKRYRGKSVWDEVGTKEQIAPAGDSLLSQFIEELTKVNGTTICSSSSELTQRVIDFLQTRGIDQIHLEPQVLDETALQRAGITFSRTSDSALRLGVTKAICGLADTGSILVVDGEGDPLQASLLPGIHLAVLHESDLLPSLADAMTLPIVRDRRAAVVITGPSRTADIEMSLTIGMHGPGELYVFLVHGTASTLVSTLVDD